MTDTGPASLQGKTILISGHHGFLGISTAVAAMRTGASVRGVDRCDCTDRADRIYRSHGVEPVPSTTADISSAATWQRLLQEVQPDAVLHLAGSIQRGNTAQDWAAGIEGNLLTTTSLLQAVAALPQNKRPAIVYPGSQMEYGRAPMPWTEDTLCLPVNPYGSVKLAAADMLLAAIRTGLFRGCVARLAVLYGPAQSPAMFIPELITRALESKKFDMTEGLQKRRFLYAGDAAALLLSIAAAILAGDPVPPLLNMPASEPKTMREIAEMTAACLPLPVSLNIGAIPTRQNEFSQSWPDDSMARAHGLSCATPLRQGLTATIAWYTKNRWFFPGAPH